MPIVSDWPKIDRENVTLELWKLYNSATRRVFGGNYVHLRTDL